MWCKDCFYFVVILFGHLNFFSVYSSGDICKYSYLILLKSYCNLIHRLSTVLFTRTGKVCGAVWHSRWK